MKPCTQCGKCCKKYGSCLGVANESDLLRFEAYSKKDLIGYVAIFDCGDYRFGDIWINPQTGEEVDKCPFLRKENKKSTYKCTIYEARPDVCRDYPYDIDQMKADQCEMLESNTP